MSREIGEILDKFAVRIWLIFLFTMLIVFIGAYVLLWFEHPWLALASTFASVVFLSFFRIVERDLKMPWN